jgi:flavin reductase (DIM6/NTAB) family NADH-FMN oxidoreductase RutF
MTSRGHSEVLSLVAARVVMVTTHVDGRRRALTISSCCSRSTGPPLVLVSLGSRDRQRRPDRSRLVVG